MSNGIHQTSIDRRHHANGIRPAPLTCVLVSTIVLLSAPVQAQSTPGSPAPQGISSATTPSAATRNELQLAPRVPLEDRSIEEGYMSSDLTRNQAAIEHASTIPTSPIGLRHLQRNDTLVVETGVRLSRDLDDDGYYSAFSLEMDVDTWDQLEVYADIFLQREFQSPRLLHTTAAFHLYGDSTSDEYHVDVSLTRNFPAGHYDLIIEIRDAWSDELLDSVSSANFRNLGSLPLEDESHRIPRNDSDSVVVEYSGATHPLGLLVLALSVARLRRRTRPATPGRD